MAYVRNEPELTLPVFKISKLVQCVKVKAGQSLQGKNSKGVKEIVKCISYFQIKLPSCEIQSLFLIRVPQAPNIT